MGRKKKISLEHEFYICSEEHKRQTISTCLAVYSDKDIYSMDVALLPYKDRDMGTDIEKSFEVEDELYQRYFHNGDQAFNRIYEMCWELMKDIVDEDKAYK